MNVTFIQTSDATFYYPMLEETAKTVRRFCNNNGFAYEQFVGVKRGQLPWQASYNRVYMLKEMLDRGYDGWVFYVDADAIVQDQGFDLRGYLADRRHHAAIFAGYTGTKAHEVNSGGFAINLGHPVGRALVLDYWREVHAIPAFDYDRALFWERDIPDDQHILCVLLEKYVGAGCGDHFLFERSNESYVNHGPFIVQQLRSNFTSFEQRLHAIREQVAGIMAAADDLRASVGRGIYIPASHERLHAGTGVKSLSAIVATGHAGTLLYGPYVDLPAGSWTVQVLGGVHHADGSDPVAMHTDISTQHGERVLSERTTPVIHHLRGVILEHPFDLSEAVDRVEFRLNVPEGIAMKVYAINIMRRPD